MWFLDQTLFCQRSLLLEDCAVCKIPSTCCTPVHPSNDWLQVIKSHIMWAVQGFWSYLVSKWHWDLNDGEVYEPLKHNLQSHKMTIFIDYMAKGNLFKNFFSGLSKNLTQIYSCASWCIPSVCHFSHLLLWVFSPLSQTPWRFSLPKKHSRFSFLLILTWTSKRFGSSIPKTIRQHHDHRSWTVM